LPDIKSFLLPAPWAHFDPRLADLGIGRRELSELELTKVVAGVPLFLVAPSGSSILVSGHRMGVEPMGGNYQLGGETYQIFLISTGTRSNEGEIEVEIDGQLAGRIKIEGFFPRPAFTGREENENVVSYLAEQIDGLILSLIDLIRLADDARYAGKQIFWERVTDAWFSQDQRMSDPPVAVIVKHANTLQKLIRDLTDRPRKILRRTRQMTSVGRVEQLDTTCIRWLSRQPGRDVWQRAGPRQRIMAVQRYETYATLENRVLRDYSIRAQISGARYTKRYSDMQERPRWQSVKSYERGCRQVELFLKDNEVSKIDPPVTPNYVLLQDLRYRRLWKAYLEIVRQQDEEDEAWRWQYRLWADAVRIMTHVAIRSSKMFAPVAENPIRIKEEQDRGTWTTVEELSGTWIINEIGLEDVVVSMVWSIRNTHHEFYEQIQGLGCTALIHLQKLSGNGEAYIPIWAIHHFTEDAPNLAEMVSSADRALRNFAQNLLLTRGEELKIAGLVVMSELQYGAGAANRPTARDGNVIGHRYQIVPDRRTRLMVRISESILVLAKELFSDEVPKL
jgi:hypothetical protein